MQPREQRFPMTGRRLRQLPILLMVMLLMACGSDDDAEATFGEQRRLRHDDSMGYPVPITYEIATDWTIGRGGRYSPPGLKAPQTMLRVRLDSARAQRRSLDEKLKAATMRGQTDGDRRVLETARITVNSAPALEYAEERTAFDGKSKSVSHKVEMTLDKYNIAISLNTAAEHYERLLPQFRHTVASVQLDPIDRDATGPGP